MLDVVSNWLKLDLKELLFQGSKSFHLLSKKEKEIVSNEIIALIKNTVVTYSIPKEN